MSDYASRIRTICYVDGFNLYYGLRDSGLRDCYWLNLRSLAERLIRPPFELRTTKYFTARVSGRHPGDSEEKAAEREAGRQRQLIYLRALDDLQALEVYEGHYIIKRDFCRACNKDFYRPEEKMTDVQIATHLLADAFLNRFDSAVVISGDSDLVPPIQMVQRHFPEKRIAVAFPPSRVSKHLRLVADEVLYVWPSSLRQCQFAQSITCNDGTVLTRPEVWQ